MTLSTTDYVAEIEAWRRDSEATLRRDWISLAGRFELQPGPQQIGSDPTSAIVLPTGSAPAVVGTLTLAAGVVTLEPATNVALLLNGESLLGPATLHSDQHGAESPDVVTLGALTFFIIERGHRTILRLRDANHPALQRFGGRRWFAIDQTYRIEGNFTPYEPPKPLNIANILGDSSDQTSPGFVTFRLNDVEQRLDATGWRNGGLVLHFHDPTNGKTTYGGGRSLVTGVPEQGLVTLDFNRTSNLPCAFTEYATCPIPPAQNRLSVPIQAGEQRPDLEL